MFLFTKILNTKPDKVRAEIITQNCSQNFKNPVTHKTQNDVDATNNSKIEARFDDQSIVFNKSERSEFNENLLKLIIVHFENDIRSSKISKIINEMMTAQNISLTQIQILILYISNICDPAYPNQNFINIICFLIQNKKTRALFSPDNVFHFEMLLSN